MPVKPRVGILQLTSSPGTAENLVRDCSSAQPCVWALVIHRLPGREWSPKWGDERYGPRSALSSCCCPPPCASVVTQTLTLPSCLPLQARSETLASKFQKKHLNSPRPVPRKLARSSPSPKHSHFTDLWSRGVCTGGQDLDLGKSGEKEEASEGKLGARCSEA